MKGAIEWSSGSTTVSLTPLPWDDSAFGARCAELAVSGESVDSSSVDNVRSWLAAQPVDMVTCRVVDGEHGTRHLLHRLGFFYAETQLDFVVGLAKREAPPADERRLRPYSPADHDAVVDVMGSAFGDSRFSTVPWIDSEMIERRFRNWTDALLGTHPHLAFVLELDGEIRGAFVSEPDPDRKNGVLLRLASVVGGGAPGLGYYLYREGLASYGAGGARVGRAAISATNLAVLNLYAGLGAKFVSAVHYHLWWRERDL